MLLKILTTIAILAAVLMLSRRRRPLAPTVSANGLLVRYLSMGLLLTTVLLTAVWLGWRWFDGNQIMRVTISAEEGATQSSYQVRKRDIGESSLVTVDGLVIRLSNRERVTIASSDQP